MCSEASPGSSWNRKGRRFCSFLCAAAVLAAAFSLAGCGSDGTKPPEEMALEETEEMTEHLEETGTAAESMEEAHETGGIRAESESESENGNGEKADSENENGENAEPENRDEENAESKNRDGEKSEPAGDDGMKNAAGLPDDKEPSQADRELVAGILQAMPLQDKISQLLFPSVRGWQGEGTCSETTGLSPAQTEAIRSLRPGGIMLFQESLSSAEAVKALTDALQSENRAGGSLSGLFIATDQEGGYVTRLYQGTMMPGNMALAASGDPENARTAAGIIGMELSSVGINTDFAPDADINSNPSNPVIGVRSFSDDPEITSVFTSAFVQGLHDSRTISCLKHFPGHGDTKTDSHNALPVVGKTREEVLDFELRPFREAADEADMIMTAHIRYPLIETGTWTSEESGQEITLPATLSETILTDILRGELGFNGVIITDSMQMGALTAHFSVSDAAKLAINAGADMLLMPAELKDEEGIAALTDLRDCLVRMVEEGEISAGRIDDAVTRVLLLKAKYGLIPGQEGRGGISNDLTDEQHAAEEEVLAGCARNHETEWELALRSIVLLKNEEGILPVSGPGKTVIACPYDTQLLSCAYAEQKLREAACIPEDLTIEWFSYENLKPEQAAAKTLDADLVIGISAMYSYTELNPMSAAGTRSSCLDAMILSVHERGVPFVLLSAQLPYDTARYTEADAVLACFLARGMPALPAEGGPQYGPNLPAALFTAFGGNKPAGRLPVNIPALNSLGQPTDEMLYPCGYFLTPDWE